MHSRRQYSRSPGPSKSPNIPSKTPTFQPPSFYAAAANIPYPSSTPLPSSQPGYTSPNIAITYPTQTLVNAYEGAVDRDNSDQHSQTQRNQRKRASSISRSLARAIPRSQKQDRDEETVSNRKSQLADIPLIEAALLPSLRDTIDRMTHPPLPADSRNKDTSRNTRIESSGGLSHGAVTADSYVPSSSPHPPTFSTRSPYATTSSQDTRVYASPHITLEEPAPDKDARSYLSPMDPPRGSSPRSIETGQLGSRIPRVQESNESRTKIPHARPSRSNPGTPKSALRTPTAPINTNASPSLSGRANTRPYASPTASSYGSSDFEQGRKWIANSKQLRVKNTVTPELSYESSESEMERDQRRLYGYTWDHHKGKNRDQTSKLTSIPAGGSKIPSQSRSNSKSRLGIGLGFHDLDRRDERAERNHQEATHRSGGGYYEQYGHRSASDRDPDAAHTKSEFRETLRKRETLMCTTGKSPVVSGGQMQLPDTTKASQTDRGRYLTTVVCTTPRSLERKELRGYRTDRTTDDDSIVERPHASRGRVKAKSVSRSPDSSQYPPHRQPETNSRSSNRNRRSSSVPAIAHTILEGRQSSQSARIEKSVRFQTKDLEDGASEDHSMSVQENRYQKIFDASQKSRRASGEPAPASHCRSSKELVNKNDDSQARRRSREISSRREREAFGIPCSLSYTGNNDGNSSCSTYEYSEGDEESNRTEEEYDYPPCSRLPHAESDLSSVDGGSWQSGAATNDLSRGAETLFKALAVTETEGTHQKRESRSRRRSSGRQEFASNAAYERGDRLAPSISISESHSAPSVYDDEADEQVSGPQVQDHRENSILRSVMRPRIYNDLLAQHGHAEMRRQDVIFELSSSEATFVRSLRSMVRRFILPLRQKDSKTWVHGVPEPVSRLFDWLEDIVNLHVSLGESLVACGDLWKAGDIVNQVAETIRAFVPRLEVYQPYLVRVDHVADLLTHAISNPDDQLGEFFRMRQRESVRDDSSIADLLLEPVKRLERYPELFEKLLKFTPRAHTDHLASLSLLHSTRMMVQVLHEVKAREREYEYSKGILSRIAAVSPSVVAQRERRLLWDGVMQSRTPLYQRSQRAERQNETERRRGYPESKEIKLVVFTDIVVLATPDSRSKGSSRAGSERWRVLDDFGVSKVLKADENGQTISLDLLPLEPENVRTGVISEIVSSQHLDLDIPPSWTLKERRQVLSALRKCHLYAIRSLSFPSHSGKYLSHGLQVDLEQDTKQSVMSIISTGLPLPKSPSVQIADVRRGNANDSVEQEREERGWWTLRFQQVMREMQRQNVDQLVEAPF